VIVVALALAVVSAAPAAAFAQSASAGAGASAGGDVSPVETALAVLERSSRPMAVYAAIAGAEMTVVAELSAASIQAGRFKDGADITVEAASTDGAPVARGRGRIDAGAYAAAIPVTIAPGAPPTRVTVRLTGTGTPAVEDWVKLPQARGSLIADPLAYRSGSRIAARPVAAFEFARNERIRVEWRAPGALDRREVRLLDRRGKPLPVDLPLSEDAQKKLLVVDMSLSGLGSGDYLIELTAGAGAVSERRLLAIRVR
jgi:hypothetical protein